MIEICDKCREIVYDSKDEKRYKIVNDLNICEGCQEFEEYEDFTQDLDWWKVKFHKKIKFAQIVRIW